MLVETRSAWRIVMLSVLGLTIACHLSRAATIRPDCVERSLCYHSTDCCNGCCEDHQCVTGKSNAQCADHNVARNCSSLKCPTHQECSQEMRLCLIAPCPQPLPKCVVKKPASSVSNDDIPLPVQYN